tara:strand:+ start:11381 stop:11614 length:234 start_codon:yes stop_codon:yes gene_type:complete
MKRKPRFQKGDLVQPRPFTCDPRGPLLFPAHPGIVKCIETSDIEAGNYIYTVVWFGRDGLKTVSEFEDKIKFYRDDD